MSVPPAVLEAMRAAQAVYMTDVCTIKRWSAGTPSSQGYKPGTATETTVPCRIAPGAKGFRGYGLEGEMAALMAGINYWTVTVPAGTDVLDTDSIEINGKWLDVKVVIQAQTTETATRLICEERSNDKAADGA